MESVSIGNITENSKPDFKFMEVSKTDPGADRARLQKATRDFEALFVYQLLKTMRESVKSEGEEEKGFGFGQDVMMSVADQAVASKIADSDAFGISKMLLEYFDAAIDPETDTDDVPAIKRTESLQIDRKSVPVKNNGNDFVKIENGERTKSGSESNIENEDHSDSNNEQPELTLLRELNGVHGVNRQLLKESSISTETAPPEDSAMK